MMTYFYAAAKSPSGFVDNYGDKIWKDALQSGTSPRDTLTEYNAHKLILDQFRGVSDYAKTNKVTLSAGKTDLTGFNHHDIVSAFVTCQISGVRPRAVVDKIPLILGYTYESLDFVSHIGDGVGVSGSIDNFQKDTDRYARGRQLSKEFCD